MSDKSASLPMVLRQKLPHNLEKIKYGSCTKGDMDYAIHMYLKENDIRIDENGSEVIQFLRGKFILVTGATGFLGKLLVEKLLRCCKDIGIIYVIIRPKKGKDMEIRLQEYLDEWVFVKLSEIYPDYRKKIVGISGDFEQDGLGLSEVSRKTLTEKVNIIYHAAATIRFDEKLKKAVRINIKGTREIIKLAKECKSLDVLTHISTAYSNSHFKEIKEEFYPPFMDADDLIDITDIISADVADRITPGLLNVCPNTYAFTKQIAEDVVRRESVGLISCIQRPSIVIGTVREPIRSWVDNICGPMGIFAAAQLGLVHAMYGDPNGRCDMVPADYVINNCIAASYKTAKDGMTDKVQIFNFTASKNNPLYWKNLNLMAQEGTKVNSTKFIMLYFYGFTKYWYWFKFLDLIFHTLPAYAVDFVLVKLGKKPLLSKAYQKLHKLMNFYYTINEWDFISNNTKELWKSLNEKDKLIFAYDMSTLDWHNYYDVLFPGIREFLLLDNLSTLEEGRAYAKRLYLTSYVIISATLALTLFLCWNTIFAFIPIFIVFLILFFSYTSYYQ